MSKSLDRAFNACCVLAVLILVPVIWWTFPVDADPAAPGKLPVKIANPTPAYEIAPYVAQKQRLPFVPY